MEKYKSSELESMFTGFLNSSATLHNDNVDIFRDSKVKPNARTFNTLMKSFTPYGDQGFYKSTALISVMKNLGIKPDSVSVNTAIHIGVSADKYDEAEAVG